MLKDKVLDILRTQEMEGKDTINEMFVGELDENPRWDSEEIADFRKQLTEAGITFKLVDRYGGEDQGSDYWSVYSFSDSSEVVFIQFDGWYASYDGSTFEEFFEVKAVEKTITVFEKK